jgi:drug/metabolite transporter (DMT)-like permease
MIFRLWKRFYENPYALLVVTMLSWAGNSVASRAAVGQIDPASITALRWVIAAGILLPICGRQLLHFAPILRQRALYLIMMGLMGFTIFNLLFYWAGHETTALNIALMQSVMPAVIMVGAFLFLRQPVTPLQWLGLILAFIGAMTVASQGDLSRIASLALNHGDAMMLLASLFYSAYSLMLRDRPAMPNLVFFTAIASSAAVSALIFLAGDVMVHGLTAPTLKGWAVLLYIAIFPSLLAQIFFIRAVQLIGAGRAGLFSNLVPIFGAGFAVLFLNEAFALFHGVALVLILGGISLSEFGRKR